VHDGLRPRRTLNSQGAGSSSGGSRTGAGNGNEGNGSVVSVASLDSVGVVDSDVVLGAGTVVVVVVDGSAVGLGARRDDDVSVADVPAAVVGNVVCAAAVVVDDEDGARPARADGDCTAGASSVVVVAHPSAMSAWVRAAGSLDADALVAVPIEALVVRCTGAPGPEATTTAVRTAAPSTALPAATVHQSRRGDRRTACRGLMRGLLARPVPRCAPRPPKRPCDDRLKSFNLVIHEPPAEEVPDPPRSRDHDFPAHARGTCDGRAALDPTRAGITPAGRGRS